MNMHKSIHLGPYIRIAPKYTNKDTTITKNTCHMCGFNSGPSMVFCGVCGSKLDTYQDNARVMVPLNIPYTLAAHEEGGYIYVFDRDKTPDVTELHDAMNITNTNMEGAIENFKTRFSWVIENDIEPNVESCEFCWGLTVGWF